MGGRLDECDWLERENIMALNISLDENNIYKDISRGEHASGKFRLEKSDAMTEKCRVWGIRLYGVIDGNTDDRRLAEALDKIDAGHRRGLDGDWRTLARTYAAARHPLAGLIEELGAALENRNKAMDEANDATLRYSREKAKIRKLNGQGFPNVRAVNEIKELMDKSTLTGEVLGNPRSRTLSMTAVAKRQERSICVASMKIRGLVNMMEGIKAVYVEYCKMGDDDVVVPGKETSV